MSQQSDEAFEAWVSTLSDFYRRSPQRASLRLAWEACLAAYADNLELARRVKALPLSWDVINFHGDRWDVCDDDEITRGRGDAALNALRNAHIGDE